MGIIGRMNECEVVRGKMGEVIFLEIGEERVSERVNVSGSAEL